MFSGSPSNQRCCAAAVHLDMFWTFNNTVNQGIDDPLTPALLRKQHGFLCPSNNHLEYSGVGLGKNRFQIHLEVSRAETVLHAVA